MSRFTLDENKAREWIAAGIAITYGRADHNPTLPGIGEWYGAELSDGMASLTWELVARALAAGIIADAEQPAEAALSFDAVPYDGETTGYHWALELPGTGGLTVRSAFTEMGYLGDSSGQQLRGAPMGLAVLREAVEAGNQIADGIAAYVAKEAGR